MLAARVVARRARAFAPLRSALCVGRAQGRGHVGLRHARALCTAPPPPQAAAAKHTVKLRADYKPPPYLVSHTDLDFQFHDKVTVQARFQMRANMHTAPNTPVQLDGKGGLELVDLTVGGVPAKAKATLSSSSLSFPPPSGVAVGETFEVVVKVRVDAAKNRSMSGLYKSGAMFCTQCEAEGFRRIVFSVDRPDVMSTYKVRIEAGSEFPMLLSNGNKVEEGVVEGSDQPRHFVVWEDTNPKPSYLFAVVVGDLVGISQRFTTSENREVLLQLLTDSPKNAPSLSFALASLVRAMQWDERTFGLACDVDNYNVVAARDFNMGAMENKGLNIFNTSLLLADPSFSTDADFMRVEGVVAHEYFHNWTGNRVTCRDWFQLTLKEGLTVFRDQEFSAHMWSEGSMRIGDVQRLRAFQFAEDRGPLAHPIRPESYVVMDNFYTATVYEKGAEVVRMYQTLLGVEGFRKGMDLYFARHDGQAVTCDDFRLAMADANGVDLTQFERWYSTKGTPRLFATPNHDPKSGAVSLTLRQEIPDSNGPNPSPLHIPVVVGALDSATGQEVLPSTLLQLTEFEQTFALPSVKSPALVFSVLRGFSAPVVLEMERAPEQLAVLMAHDTDAFNRWEAGQVLGTNLILREYAGVHDAATQHLRATFLQAVERSLARLHSQPSADLLADALCLQLTPITVVMNSIPKNLNPTALFLAHKSVVRQLAVHCRDWFWMLYDPELCAQPYVLDRESVGRRGFNNLCLLYLCAMGEPEGLALAYSQFERATNMTDRIVAFRMIVESEDDHKTAAINQMYQRADNDQALDLWFSVQAQACAQGQGQRVKELVKHPDFTFANPNRLRSLVGAFTHNPVHFHGEDGSGYEFVANAILRVDQMNPQVASRLAVALTKQNLEPKRARAMRAQLERLRDTPQLSADTRETVERALGAL